MFWQNISEATDPQCSLCMDEVFKKSYFRTIVQRASIMSNNSFIGCQGFFVFFKYEEEAGWLIKLKLPRTPNSCIAHDFRDESYSGSLQPCDLFMLY